MQNALILWFRRDFRLDDHPMVAAAVATGRPLVPVFILDPQTEALGAAPKWRLWQAIAAFSARLAGMGSRLILRRGPAEQVLLTLIQEMGAAGVMWQRMYDPASMARDSGVKAMLTARGLVAQSQGGALLAEPWQIKTGQGGTYQVYTPFWRAVAGRDFGVPLAAPRQLPAPDTWPACADLGDLGARMGRGAAVVARHAGVGETVALGRLDDFLSGPVGPYKSARDDMAAGATSNLSENLAMGEISPRRIWSNSLRAPDASGPEHFRKELVWREFAYHLMYHSPHMLTENWRAGWEDFPWRGDCDDAEAWRRGQTGEPIIDAAMREVYVTGRMHNRARMIVASYLTKHLLIHWRVGQDWFAQILTDWDAASNALGWQWVAGCGPDAAPYFRVFNPSLQAEKFDAEGRYRRHWLQGAGDAEFRAAHPMSWGDVTPPRKPVIDLAQGRDRALAAYRAK